MPIILDGTAGIANNATDISYTGTLTAAIQELKALITTLTQRISALEAK